MSRLSGIVIALALATGCGTTGGGTSPSTTEGPAAAAVDVAKIAELARKVKADPARGEALLREAGLDRKQLEDALFAIAADPAMSEEYAKLFRQR
jgi:hypothetical protein